MGAIAASLLKRQLLFLLPLLSLGQEPESVLRGTPQLESFKSEAPVSDKVPVIRLPKPFETQLPNGVNVMVIENHRVPTVHVVIRIEGAGGLYESSQLRGLALAAAQMLLDRDEAGGAINLRQKLEQDGVAVQASAGCGDGATILWVSGLSSNVRDWFPVLADSMLHPHFSSGNLDRFVQRRTAELSREGMSSSFLAASHLLAAILGTYPGAIIAPSPATVGKYTPDHLERWLSDHYTPQNTTVAFSGDIASHSAIEIVRETLGSWKTRVQSPNKSAVPVAPEVSRRFLVKRPQSAQATIWAGSLGASRGDKDYYPLVVLCSALGGGPGSRLYSTLRSRLGVAYSVGSSFPSGESSAVWIARADVNVNAVKQAVSSLLAEIARFTSEPMSPDELSATKKALVSSRAFLLEHRINVLNLLMDDHAFGIPRYETNLAAERISQVSASDVLRAAHRFLDSSKLQLVVVGPEELTGTEFSGFTVAAADPKVSGKLE